MEKKKTIYSESEKENFLFLGHIIRNIEIESDMTWTKEIDKEIENFNIISYLFIHLDNNWENAFVFLVSELKV